MSNNFPRKVFRVMYHKDGTPFVTERQMVSRSGSWFVTERKDGTQQKENGNYWSDTILEAIQREAGHVMHRFRIPSVFDSRNQLESMNGIIREAMEWGKLLGESNFLSDIASLRRRVAELESKVSGYEAEMHAAISECEIYAKCNDMSVSAARELAQHVIECLGPLCHTAPAEVQGVVEERP